jgi:O-antigen/teichoic acid export membrane protein
MSANSPQSPRIAPRPVSSLNNIIRTAGVTGGSTLFAQAAGYLMVFALTLSLGIGGFGLFSLATTVMGITTLVATLGLDVTVVRFAAWYRGRGETPKLEALLFFVMAFVLAWSVVVAVGLWGLAPFLSVKLFREPELVSLVRIASVGLPVNALFAIFVSGLHGCGLTTRRVYAEQIILPTSRLLFIVIAGTTKAGVQAALWAMVAAAGLSMVIAGWWLTRASRFWKSSRVGLPDLKAWAKYATPAFLDSLLVTPLGGSLEIFFLGMFGTKEMVAVYSIVLRFKFIVTLPMAAFNTTLAPLISEAHARLDREQLKELYGSATRWIMMLSLPLIAVNVLFGSLLLGLFGQAYTVGYVTLALMTLGQLVNVCTGPSGHMLLMTGYSRIRLFNSLVLLATQLGLGMLLIPMWRLEGAGIVSAASIAMVSLLGLLEVAVLLRVHPYRWEMVKPLVACGLSGAVVAVGQFVLKESPFTVVLLLGVLVFIYGGVLVGLGLNQDDKQIALQAKSRLRLDHS